MGESTLLGTFIYLRYISISSLPIFPCLQWHDRRVGGWAFPFQAGRYFENVPLAAEALLRWLVTLVSSAFLQLIIKDVKK